MSASDGLVPPRPAAAPRRRAALLLALLLATGVAACRTGAGATAAPGADERTSAESGVRRMLEHGAAAWNAGDLDAFMNDYLPGDGTTYIGRSGIVRGPAAIRAIYAPRFRPGVERGRLRFENLEVDVLAPGVANAIAWYVLTVGDSTIARGPTSLVMRRVGERWLIVHDHSS